MTSSKHMHSKSHSSNAFARRGKRMLQSTSSARSLKKKTLPSGILESAAIKSPQGSFLFFSFSVLSMQMSKAFCCLRKQLYGPREQKGPPDKGSHILHRLSSSSTRSSSYCAMGHRKGGSIKLTTLYRDDRQIAR